MTTKPTFRVTGSGTLWQWHLVSPNGVILATCWNPYTRRRDAYRAIDTVVQSIFDAGIEGKA
jgi:uncharacterized protein YegP (UPF0339 family)